MTIQMHTTLNQVQPLNGDLHTGHVTSSCMTSSDVIMYDVITDHKNIYVNNSSQNGDKAVGEVSLCLSRQDASNDMQYYLPGPFTRSGHLT